MDTKDNDYSMVEITYVDGTVVPFMLSAGTGIAGYLRDQLRDTHALLLRNETDVLVVPREQLRCFMLRAMTKGERK